MKVLFCFLLLTVSAAAQYAVTDFAGPWLPGVFATAMPPNAFTHSENFFVHRGPADGVPGYRIQRRGLIQALPSSMGSGAVLAHKSFWHEGDSLAVLFFHGGKWYYSNYAAVSYGKTNWYEGDGLTSTSYDANYVLNTPKEVRPYSAGTVDFVTGLDSLEADSENASLFFRFAAAGDTVRLDTNGNGTFETTVGAVERVVKNNRLILDTAGGLPTMTNDPYQFERSFSGSAVPDIEVHDRRAYVTNGVDPMQVIFWYDSTLWLREVHTAQRVPINDVHSWFNDTVNEWVSPERLTDPASDADSANIRFMRLYSWSKAWEFGEWSGGLTVGPTEMYFFRFGSNAGSASTGQTNVRICPILYNDENSLVLLNPLLGERDTIFRTDSIFAQYYPYFEQNDTTSFHAELINNLVGHEGYVLSMAGNLEVVLDRSVTGSIDAVANASIFVSEDADVLGLVPAGAVRLNDEIYFIHSFNPEQNQNRTIIEQETFRYQFFPAGRVPAPLPEGWEIVSWQIKQKNDHGQWGYYPIPQQDFEGFGALVGLVGGRVQVKIPNIDTTEIAVSAREFYPVRYAIGSSAGDSVVFITANQPASSGPTGTWDTVTITDWELVRAEVPRFSGIEAHSRIGLVGWGDTTDAGLLSRSALTVRGPELENWSAALDVRITDNHDPIVAVESHNDFETVLTRSQIFGAQLSSAGFWTYEELTKNVGCGAPRSVVTINDELFFRGNDAQFYRMRRRAYTGFEFVSISEQIAPLLNRMDRSTSFGHGGTHLTENQEKVGFELGVWDPRARRIWWFLAMDTATVPNYALTYDPHTNLWDGVHTLGAASVDTVRLRDTVFLLLGDPSNGMLAWANVGVGDSGVKINSVVEGVFSGPGDTLRIKPERMTLTFSTDANATPGTDSLIWTVANLAASEFASGSDVAVRSPAGTEGNYLAVQRFLTPDAGSAVFWRYRLEHRGDLTNTLRRFQPLRATVALLPGGTGD